MTRKRFPSAPEIFGTLAPPRSRRRSRRFQTPARRSHDTPELARKLVRWVGGGDDEESIVSRRGRSVPKPTA